MSDIKFSTFDAAQYLETENEFRAFLDEARKDGNPTTITLALGAIARARVISQIAQNAGMTRARVYEALAADGNPGSATVSRIAPGAWLLPCTEASRGCFRWILDSDRIGKLVLLARSDFSALILHAREQYAPVMPVTRLFLAQSASKRSTSSTRDLSGRL